MHAQNVPAPAVVRDTRPATSARFTRAVVRRLDRAPELRKQDLASIEQALANVKVLTDRVAS